jgi:dGTPase
MGGQGFDQAFLHAPYAAKPAESRGRLHPEPASSSRSDFQRDCDRIVHATAFRRLKDKTQVFLTGGGDHYRNRLTHTLEVSRIARTIARALRLDEDLAEAIALAHDLGHPPFGHAGERALDAAMRAHGGFDHNIQTLRVVTLLERRYPLFDGINLSFETLEGLVKHNGPSAAVPYWHGPEPAPRPDQFGSAEAQVAALADDIAYDAHDIDDGIRAGLLDLDGLRTVEGPAAIVALVDKLHPGLDTPRAVNELVRRLIAHLVDDVIQESRSRLFRSGLASLDGVRAHGAAVVGFSASGAAIDGAIKEHLRARVYRHPEVTNAVDEAASLIGRLFDRYWEDEEALPPEWRDASASLDERGRARLIADFIAGQTDRYALAEAERLFDGAAKSG